MSLFRRRPLSIGWRWALRYAVAILVSLTAFSLFAYSRTEKQATREGRRLLERQAAELAGRVVEGFENIDELRGYVTSVADAEPYLKISVQVFDDNGRILYGRGILPSHEIGIPPDFVRSSRDSHFYEADLNKRFPYWVVVARAGEMFVQVGAYSREFVRPARELRTMLLTATPVVVVFSLALGWWLARTSLRPLSEITATTRRITGSRLDEPIPTTGTGDELDELAHTLEEMRVRIRDSVEKLRHFSADAAHQLRTPLSKLRSRLELTLESEPLSPSIRKTLEENLCEIDQLGSAVTAMLQLASSEAGLAPGQSELIELGGLLDSVVEFYEPLAAENQLKLARTDQNQVRVMGDLAWLRQLFGNLVENAILHTEAGGRIEVEAEERDGEARVEVRDTGTGIDPGSLERIFDRFHRGRSGGDSPAPGAGLGLTIAGQIAEAHGGRIGVESDAGAGSVFSVGLPAV